MDNQPKKEYMKVYSNVKYNKKLNDSSDGRRSSDSNMDTHTELNNLRKINKELSEVCQESQAEIERLKNELEGKEMLLNQQKQMIYD